MRVMCVLVFHSSFGDATLRLSFIYSFTHTLTRVIFHENEGVHDFARSVMHAALRKSVVYFDHFLEIAEGGGGGWRRKKEREVEEKDKV